MTKRELERIRERAVTVPDSWHCKADLLALCDEVNRLRKALADVRDIAGYSPIVAAVDYTLGDRK